MTSLDKPAFVAAARMASLAAPPATAVVAPAFKALLKAVRPEISSRVCWDMFLATSLASADASARLKLLRALSLIAFLDATFACAKAYSAASCDAFAVAASKISFFSDNIFLASSKASKALLPCQQLFQLQPFLSLL